MISLSILLCMDMLYPMQFYHVSIFCICEWNEWIVELECGRDGKKKTIRFITERHMHTSSEKSKKQQNRKKQ